MVNNFFAHWIKEVDIKLYPDDIRILPINNTVDIYRYSEKMLKHSPAKSLDTLKETLLYDKTKVILPGGRGRRSNTSNTSGDRTDANLGSRITKFRTLLPQKLYYRIPLEYFVYLGLVNFPEKTDTNFIFTLESNMNKLFEFNAKVDNILQRQTHKLYIKTHPIFLTSKYPWMKISKFIFTQFCVLKKLLGPGCNFHLINKLSR